MNKLKVGINSLNFFVSVWEIFIVMLFICIIVL